MNQSPAHDLGGELRRIVHQPWSEETRATRALAFVYGLLRAIGAGDVRLVNARIQPSVATEAEAEGCRDCQGDIEVGDAIAFVGEKHEFGPFHVGCAKA